MNKHIMSILMLCTVTGALLLSGCGNGSGTSTGSAAQTVFGVAASGRPVSGMVTIQDSSMPPVLQSTITGTGGNYSLDVSRLKAPFILTVTSQTSGTTTATELYSFSQGSGRANINPFSHVMVAAAAKISDPSAISSNPDSGMMDTLSKNHQSAMDALKAKLAPLFELYGVTQDPVTDEFEADHTGLDALFDEVSITISQGTILVTNKQTGSVIFTAPVMDVSSGTFYAQNLPGSTGGTPTACTYSYSTWGTCQSNGTQTRTMLTSSPSGCTGTAVLSQSCTYVPPTPTACTYTYSPWGTCQSNNTQTRTMLTSSPSGCTGTPVLSQSCTYVPPTPTACTYTYSAWDTCQSNNTQTRTVVTTSPSGCTGTPVLSQSCMYVPPATLTKAEVTSSCTACHGLTSNTTVFKSGGYTVVGRSASQWLTTVNTMVGFGASLAPGFTAQDYANYLATAP